MSNGTVAEVKGNSAGKRQQVVIRCPMDSEVFDSLEELSQHVDQVHIGPGVLGGLGQESWGTFKKKKAQ